MEKKFSKAEELMKLKELLDCGAITNDEFIALKSEIINGEADSPDIATSNVIPMKNDDSKDNAVEMRKFKIAGKTILLPEGFEGEFASTFGMFLGLSERIVNDMRDCYDKCKNIGKALEVLPELAKKCTDDTINLALGYLYHNGVMIGPQSFFEKYYYQHGIDYNHYYDEVVEAYAKVMNLRDEMRDYREREKASRGRWIGGGFGIKGAIKGAVSASVMNAASDFVHSFGDSAARKRDEEEIKEILKGLYNSGETKALLCDSIGDCILEIYYSMRDELVESGMIRNEFFALDHYRANEIFDNAVKYHIDTDDLVNKIIECIKIFPGDFRYYDAIMGDIVAEDSNSNEGVDLNAFFKYWGIDKVYKKQDFDNDIQTEDERRRVSIIKKAIVGSIFENDDNTMMCDINEQIKRKIVRATAIKTPGHFLVFSYYVILTDRYICFIESRKAYALNSLISIDIINVDEPSSNHTVQMKLDNNTQYCENNTKMSLADLYTVVFYAKLMIGKANEYSLQMWDGFKKARELDSFISKTTKMESISSIDDYIKIRSLFIEYVPMIDNSTIIRYTKYCEDIIKILRDIDEYLQEKIMEDDRILDCYQSEKGLETFLFELRRDREFLSESNLYGVWILGDDFSELTSYYYLKKIFNKPDYNFIMFADFSFDETMTAGFALVNDYLFDIKRKEQYYLKDIIDIEVRKRSLCFDVGEKKLEYKKRFIEEGDYWYSHCGLIHMVNILKYICVNFYGNKHLIISSNINQINDSDLDMSGLQNMTENTANNSSVSVCFNSEYTENREMAERYNSFIDYMCSIGYPISKQRDLYSVSQVMHVNVLEMIRNDENTMRDFMLKVLAFIDVHFDKSNYEDYYKKLYDEKMPSLEGDGEIVTLDWIDKMNRIPNMQILIKSDLFRYLPDSYDIEKYVAIMKEFFSVFQLFIFRHYRGVSNLNKLEKEISKLLEPSEHELLSFKTSGFGSNGGFILTQNRLIKLGSKEYTYLDNIVSFSVVDGYTMRANTSDGSIDFCFMNKKASEYESDNRPYMLSNNELKGFEEFFNEILRRYQISNESANTLVQDSVNKESLYNMKSLYEIEDKSDLVYNDFMIFEDGNSWNFIDYCKDNVGYYTFVKGDDFCTARNVNPGSSFQDIISRYGVNYWRSEVEDYTKTAFYYLSKENEGIVNSDIMQLQYSKYEYRFSLFNDNKTEMYSLFFYFDDEYTIVLIGYLKLFVKQEE